jgi:hypothetical protein
MTEQKVEDVMNATPMSGVGILNPFAVCLALQAKQIAFWQKLMGF